MTYKTLEGRFDDQFSIERYPLREEEVERKHPSCAVSELQRQFPHAWVILRTIAPETRCNFTARSLESLFSGMDEFSSLVPLYVAEDFQNDPAGQRFVESLRSHLEETYQSSSSWSALNAILGIEHSDIPEDSALVVADKYIVRRGKDKSVDVYCLDRDLLPWIYEPPLDDGMTLTRTLRSYEVQELVERDDSNYMARLGTNFSHETDCQSSHFVDDPQYSGVMIEVRQTRFIDFAGRQHPSALIPHLLQVERVYWKDTWYDSVGEFKEDFAKSPLTIFK